MGIEKTLFDGMSEEGKPLAELLGMNEGENKDVETLKKLAEGGNKNMMTLLGIKYMNGEGISKDPLLCTYRSVVYPGQCDRIQKSGNCRL